MSVTKDANSTAASSFGGVTTHDHSNLTIGASANALVVVINFDGKGPTSVTATWDQGGSNQAMTALASIDSNGSFGHSAIFGLRNPVTGNRTLRVTWAANNSGQVYAWSLNGADVTSDATAFPTSGRTTATGVGGVGGVATIAITSASGNFTVSGVATESVLGDPKQATEAYYNNTSNPNTNTGAREATGAATVTHEWTVTAGDNKYSSVGVTVSPGGGGGGPTLPWLPRHTTMQGVKGAQWLVGGMTPPTKS